jgi:hypothetical protein
MGRLWEKMQQLTTTFKNQMYKAAFLDEVIKTNLSKTGYEI